MKAGLSQSVRLGQELKINPRLYQAMDMLYGGRGDSDDAAEREPL